jgi:hypothetical protein
MANALFLLIPAIPEKSSTAAENTLTGERKCFRSGPKEALPIQSMDFRAIQYFKSS